MLLALKAGLTTDEPRQNPWGSALSNTFTVFWSSRCIRDDFQSPHCQMLNSRFFTSCQEDFLQDESVALTGHFLVLLFWHLLDNYCPFLLVLGCKVIRQQRWAWLQHLPKIWFTMTKAYGTTPQTGYGSYVRLRMPKAVCVTSRHNGVAWFKYPLV